MDFARVLVLVSDFFDEIDERFAVIGALGLAAQGHSRATFDVDIDEIKGYSRRYELEALLDRLE